MQPALVAVQRGSISRRCLIMIMTRPSHSLSLISFCSTIQYQDPEGLGGPQTSHPQGDSQNTQKMKSWKTTKHIQHADFIWVRAAALSPPEWLCLCRVNRWARSPPCKALQQSQLWCRMSGMLLHTAWVSDRIHHLTWAVRVSAFGGESNRKVEYVVL